MPAAPGRAGLATAGGKARTIRAVGELWDPSAPGVVRLPSGRLVRGRALSRPLPAGPGPAFGVYLLGRRPPAVPWESRGRTGTALACLAILDGVPSSLAVAFVRGYYHPHAVETRGQRRYAVRWPGER